VNDSNHFPMHVGIVVTSAAQLAAVYALLGGASSVAVAAAAPSPAAVSGNVAARVKQGTAPVSAGPGTSAPENQASDGNGLTATSDASPSDEIDAHGWPWSADLHASTKGKTKDGLWRMKVGVNRPDPKPGFPVGAATGTSASGAASDAGASATMGAASSQAPTTDEDDEFAAFRAAAAKSDAEDAAAKASVPARKWTDADLGALCNQAAVKMGDPSPVKEIIARFIPEGQVAHSRNIPEDQREAFAKAVEEKAGIEFAG